METKIQMGPVFLNVNDVEQVSAFYEHLGFYASKDDDQVTLSLEDYPLLVLHKTTLPRKHEVGLYCLGLKVDTLEDFTGFCLYLKDQNIKIIGTSTYPCMKSLYFTDPENNGLEVYVDLPVKDSCLNPEERKVMNPLNLRELEKGSIKVSSPIPKNTRIGRIHLHVIKLEDSEEYYKVNLGLEKSYTGKNSSYLSQFNHENYIGLNTWLPGGPSFKNHLSPGLRGFSIFMDSSLFDKLYPEHKDKIELVDPNQIRTTVFRGV